MRSPGRVVETGAWSEPSTSSTGAFSPTRASSAPVIVAWSSWGAPCSFERNRTGARRTIWVTVLPVSIAYSAPSGPMVAARTCSR